MTGTVGAAALHDLRGTLQGSLLQPGDAGYDEARVLFNAMVDAHPAAIAQCRDVDDVRAAIACARASGLPTAVRAGGHSVAGSSTADGGFVIDVRGLKQVAVDPRARTVRCGAGLTWGELDAATQAHGLATTGGRVSTTGVAGLTLGGGSGWLERLHGLACDNLIAVELVTAAGELVRASADEHADLFWALHGGGGNFGVATAFEFALHPVGPQVVAGLMLFEAARGRELLTLMRDTIEGGAPEQLALAVVYLTGPPEPFVPPQLQGALCCGLAFLWAGEDHADGQAHAAVFRELEPAADLVGAMPYAEFQKMIDDPPGLRNYWTGDYLETLPDAAIETFAEQSEQMPVPSACQSIMFPWGGAVARRAAETPMAKRDATWVCHPFALWEEAADDAAHIGWARTISAAMRAYGNGGVYLNFVGDEGAARVRAAFGDDYERLARVKATYDPDNFFRFNQNIAPAPATPA